MHITYTPDIDPLTMAADLLEHAAEILRSEGYAGLADHAESVADETNYIAEFSEIMAPVAPAMVERRSTGQGIWKGGC